MHSTETPEFQRATDQLLLWHSMYIDAMRDGAEALAHCNFRACQAWSLYLSLLAGVHDGT